MRTRTGYSMGVWLTAVLLVAFAVGCGDNHNTGSDNLPTIPTATTVSSVTPLDKATGVAINTKIITATFSQAMNPTTLTTGTFTLACPVGTAQTGAVSYVANGNVATLTLAGNLPASTKCTATITTGVTNVAGNALDVPYTWTFTTGVTADTTKPLVTLTAPLTTTPGPTLAVPTNTAITAVFNEDMTPILAASFTLTCATCVLPPTGTVSYAVGSRTAIFAPTAVLESGKTYTATIKGTGASPATDLAGNALAGNPAFPTTANDYVWTFTTAAVVPAASVSVPSANLNPAAGAPAVCANSAINATFTVPSGLRMDPLTVNAGTFTLTGPGVTNVLASSVVLDGPTGLIATFTPQNALTPGVLYTATIKGGATGVKDLAIPANTMVVDKTWTFTAGPATVNCQAPEPLGAASLYGFFSGSGLTNQGNDPYSRITGDAGTTGAAVAITGFHDSLNNKYTEGVGCIQGQATGCGLVTGTIYFAGGPATAAFNAANTAFTNLSPAVRTGGLDVTTNSLVGAGGLPGELGGRTLAPGVYYSVAGGVATYAITVGDLTLDAQGNANAVWVFQAATTLTVSSPSGPLLTVSRTVHLINGAQAKNVFWYVGTAATINTGSHMVGNIISNLATTFGTSDSRVPPPVGAITTLEGRAMSLTAGVTMVNTQITVPAP